MKVLAHGRCALGRHCCCHFGGPWPGDAGLLWPMARSQPCSVKPRGRAPGALLSTRPQTLRPQFSALEGGCEVTWLLLPSRERMRR